MKWPSVIASLIISLFALLLLFVALTPVYDAFMHPRFRPLTLLGGYFMMALAIFSAGNRLYSIQPIQLLVLSFSLLAMGASAVIHYPRNPEIQYSSETISEQPLPVDSLPPKFEDGNYVRISVPELFLLTLDQKEKALGLPVMLRAIALRRDDLDRENRIAAGRVFLSCCAADSVRLIFLVNLPPETDLSLVQDGSWILIKGNVSELPADNSLQPDTDGLSADSFSAMDIMNTSYMLDAMEVTAIREPAMFFTDTLRTAEPFTF
ncbi:hypothetical protein [Marispirochaeta sp.]|uniref:hypothetical protein n=1 Tax=Marispirochaeta sp. TaxID=2038653 RepID=UPI0029C816FF|nr:hypothetical protein [Marispirochaeta sp.]